MEVRISVQEVKSCGGRHFLLTFGRSGRKEIGGCFEGCLSHPSVVATKARFLTATWVSILPEFWGVPMEAILFKWREVVLPYLFGSFFGLLACLGAVVPLFFCFFWMVFLPSLYFSLHHSICLLYCFASINTFHHSKKKKKNL
eukprot:TRINITY_DN6183_c0_g2_i1.p1 TRINITY_DN6183_c0_g2~~TRINITY_DN6183_c0_g2_i1.p1  ORF type:complete len:143 (+),score=12.01 TRINITY_DN6183_c0_g2_i1:554-982(+)